MALRLNLWQSANGFTRIYLNGLPVDGKAWLVSKRGRTTVEFERGSSGMPADQVLALVGDVAGCDAYDWTALVAAVEIMPASPRGRAPGMMAANRRNGSDAYRPERWTEADAEFLDPNRIEHPLTQETVLVVDDREPAEMVDRLRAVPKLKIEIASLETGDYVVPGKLVIERKTAADLANSITSDSKRLFWQTDRIASSGERGLLLLERDFYQQTNMSLPSITGTLTYLSVIQGVSVVPTLSLAHSAYTIVKAIRHAVQGLGYELNLRGSGPRNPSAAAAFVLEGVPGVSAVTAQALIAHFGSLAKVAMADVASLLAVPGVGPKRAQTIFDVFRAEP